MHDPKGTKSARASVWGYITSAAITNAEALIVSETAFNIFQDGLSPRLRSKNFHLVETNSKGNLAFLFF